MSPQDFGNPGVVVQKPRSDVYAVMLILSLLAILVAIGMLCLEMNAFDWDIKANDINMRTAPAAAPAAAPTA